MSQLSTKLSALVGQTVSAPVVDTYFKVERDIALEIGKEITGKPCKLASDFIYDKTNLGHKMKGLRWNPGYKQVVMLTNREVRSNVQRYLEKGCKIWLLDVNMGEVIEFPVPDLLILSTKDQLKVKKVVYAKQYNDQIVSTIMRLLDDQQRFYAEARKEYSIEKLIEYNLKSTKDIPRHVLEEVAMTWAEPLGYQFSGRIKERELTISDYNPNSFTILPYAAQEGYYFKGQFCETLIPDSRKEITIGHKSVLRKRLGVAVEELEMFYDFFTMLVVTNTVEDSLELGYEFCETCKLPVYVPENDLQIFTEDTVPYCKNCGRIARPYLDNNNNWIDPDDDLTNVDYEDTVDFIHEQNAYEAKLALQQHLYENDWKITTTCPHCDHAYIADISDGFAECPVCHETEDYTELV